jgi:nucleoside-diphosphate-sugar epimerase
MIIGNGLLASAFRNSKMNFDDSIIFASGVSNSLEENQEEYDREESLIKQIILKNRDLKFIYFSSSSVGLIENKYYYFKLSMEKLIKDSTSNYIIFRVPQIVGKSGNSKNLVNFLKNAIINQEKLTVCQNAIRFLIDVEDLVNVVYYCKDKQNCKILNFYGIEKTNVIDLCNSIGNILQKKPVLNIVDDKKYETPLLKNSDIILEAIASINISNYTSNVLKKYI